MCEWGIYKKVKLCKPRPNSGRIEIYVDSCIADLVQALNSFGISTEGSCCSHYKGLGTIMLSDGRVLLIAKDYEIARKTGALING